MGPAPLALAGLPATGTGDVTGINNADWPGLPGQGPANGRVAQAGHGANYNWWPGLLGAAA